MIKYPNGSVPYSEDKSVASIAKRFMCASLNHHPRRDTGSWCFGYGYVCERCYMYADPWSSDRLRKTVDMLNTSNASQEDLMAVCRGVPPDRLRKDEP